MTAEDRLRPVIKMTSPEGDFYEALWQGSPRNKSKKLGIFNYPQFKGEIVQDLDVGSDRYPMTIFFEGEDHDLDAEDFYDSASQNGQWDVVHPVKGPLALQLISITENNMPVESINIISFDLEWIVPANVLIVLSAEEIVAAVNAQAVNTNLSFLDQLSQLKQNTFAAIEAAKNAIDAATNIIDSVLGPISATITELNDAFNGIVSSINNLLDSALIDPFALLGQITNLVQLPLLALNDFQSRIDSYRDVADQVFNLAPSGTTDADFNTTLINELVLGSVLVASAQISATSEFTTRSQVIDAAEQTTQLLLDTVNNLDTQQANFDSVDIDNQYFSQSSAYNDILFLTALSQKNLLLSIFDLKVEKRFTLKKKRSPLEITVTEKGGLGENDRNYDEFISSNNLQGDDILILPSGREVVIYG